MNIKAKFLHPKKALDSQNTHTTQKTLILAVETSAIIGSVAIALGEQLLAQATFSAPMKHSAELFPAVCTLLDRFDRKPKQIEHIYISVGPGSFTGLRIAAAFAKTMHLANSAKVIAVDTLDVITANVSDYVKKENIVIEKIATILDAKRGQFFIAVYQRRPCKTSNTKCQIPNTQYEKICPDSLMTASQFLERFAQKNQPIWLLGVGLTYYKDKFNADGVRFLDKHYWNPRAEKVHLLGWKKAQAGQFADPLTLQPIYLRRPV